MPHLDAVEPILSHPNPNCQASCTFLICKPPSDNYLLLGPKAPSLKLQTGVCLFFVFFSVVLHVWYMLMSQLASEPEQVATSDLECSYDL